MSTSRTGTLEALRARCGVDRILLSSAANIRWATGFTGSNALVWIASEGIDLVTDGRYRDQAQTEAPGCAVHIATGDLAAFSASETLVPPTSRIAFDPEHLSVARHQSLASLFPGVTWIPVERLLAVSRARKDDREVQAIRRAQAITEAVFREVTGLISPGMTELDVAAEITFRHLRAGASAMSFEPIVASGPRSALPHARPSSRTLAAGEPILLDFGCVVDGYASDMTRMVSLGEPGDEVRRVHASVNRALDAALGAARSGMLASDLDETAREELRRDGLAEWFSHSLGHGVGLEIHEWPAVSFRNDARLPDEAVVTLEPGVYLTGRFGVRIEDMVQLSESGCTRITDLSTELLIV